MQPSICSASSAVCAEAKKAPPVPIIAAYVFFAAAAGALYHIVVDSERPESAVITLAELVQCLALLLLAAQVVSTGSVASISARAIGIEALALTCRLSSTLFYNGYLPADESGDWFFQCIDMFALVTVMWLLYQVCVEKSSTFMKDQDSMPVGALIFGCFTTAAVLHASMNLRPFFDTMWMAGLFLGTVAVLPQLWLIMRTGGRVPMLMSHHIAAMAVGRILAGYFMWLAREEIDCKPWITGINHSMIAILGAHLLHIVLIADFAHVYVKALAAHGLKYDLVLEDCGLYV